MSLGKKKIQLQGAAAAEFDPLQNFETVTYTGNGGTQKITGYIRKGAAFNGSSSVVNLGNNFNTIVSNDFSISAWVNVNSMGGQIFGKGIWATNGEYVRLYTRASTPRIQFGFEDGSGNNVSMSTNSTDLTGLGWKHIVAIGDYTNGKYKLYLDGVLLEEQNISGSLNMTNTESARIGNRESNNGPFNGKIDQVRIFNRALDETTDGEVTTLYGETYASSTKSTTDIFGDGSGVALYELDEDADDTGGSYDGTPTNVNFLGMAFQPDFVWIKERANTGTDSHRLFDSVRGATKRLYSDSDSAESTASNSLTSFDTNGFSLGNEAGVNGNGSTYVAWCWKAGGAAVSNTEGDITSQVSANPDAGFSIVKYTGNGTAGATIGHGLSSAPDLLIVKNLDATKDWYVFSELLGQSGGEYQFLELNTTDAATTFNTQEVWNGDLPTSSVFTLTAGSADNQNNNDYIAYCFTSITGYQKVGSYTGTGATGNVINVGFKPRFLMWKKTNGAVGWFILDGARNTSDVWSARVEAHNNNAEAGPDTYTVTVSNTGFEMTGSFSNWTGSNELNSTYIYLAIA